MSLQDALIKAGHAEAKKIEIPNGWKKCEIHGIDELPINSSLLVPLMHGKAGTSCTPWKNGKLTIHIRGIENDPRRFKPVLQKALDNIKSVYPQCEILWY